MIIKMIITVMMRMCVCLIDMKMTLLVNRGGHEVVFHVRMRILYMSHLLLLGKFKYGGGPIFKVVLEC